MTTAPGANGTHVVYKYAIEECDINESKQDALRAYRRVRQNCLEHIRGPSTYPIYRQLSKLAWHTAVFQTLNEARRLEPDAPVNGPAWELIREGYASLMALGIRRLLDKDKRRISLAWAVDKLEKNSYLMTREFYICHDGLPYDYETSRARYYEAMNEYERLETCFHPTTGPDGWAMSEAMHEEFDKLCGHPSRRSRDDKINKSVFKSMKELLSHESITTVERMASKVIAHAVIIKPGEEGIVIPTHQVSLLPWKPLSGLPTLSAQESFLMFT